MGPIALFDKSFLQALNVDESVWFDWFFHANVCPVFYVETLADLAKPPQKGHSPELEVKALARKFPELAGSPCAHHVSICLDNLTGGFTPMNGQVPVAGGRRVRSDSKTAVFFEQPPEVEAFQRWQRAEFEDVERLFAAHWRRALASAGTARMAGALGLNRGPSRKFRTLVEVLSEARKIVNSPSSVPKLLEAAGIVLNLSAEQRAQIQGRMRAKGVTTLPRYAPYAAHVLTVDIFNALAPAALVSRERTSNRMDIAYLYYLPFCNVFVSSDRLHRRCAPLFLRSDQSFVWGWDLKADLKRLNSRYAELPEQTKELGNSTFASSPPKDGGFMVSSYWDRYRPGWRTSPELSLPPGSKMPEGLVEEIERLRKAPALLGPHGFPSSRLDAVIIDRTITRKKGSWWQVPKDI